MVFPLVNSSLSYITGFTADGVLYFQPEWDATREDVTVAPVKALGIDLTPYGDPTGFLSERFSDLDSISAHNRVHRRGCGQGLYHRKHGWDLPGTGFHHPRGNRGHPLPGFPCTEQ